MRGDSVSHLWEVWAQREARVCSEFPAEQDSNHHRGALEQTPSHYLPSATRTSQGAGMVGLLSLRSITTTVSVAEPTRGGCPLSVAVSTSLWGIGLSQRFCGLGGPVQICPRRQFQGLCGTTTSTVLSARCPLLCSPAAFIKLGSNSISLGSGPPRAATWKQTDSLPCPPALTPYKALCQQSSSKVL